MKTQEDTLFPTARDIVYEQNKDKNQLRSKIMQVRMQIKNKGFKKKGHNKYQNYDHYTIDDILEACYPLLIEYNLATWYNWDMEKRIASLEITDLDTGYTDTVTIEDPELTWKNANEQLQGLGKRQTYIRKYLYIQLLDISENDPDNHFGQTNIKESQTNKNTTQNITYKHPSIIQYMIVELQEKNIPITKKALREYTTKQLKNNLITQKEYNTILHYIQQLPDNIPTNI